MRIRCDRSQLSGALAIALRAVSPSSTLAILRNVLLETQDDKLRLTATDLDTSIHVTVPAEVEENGAVAVTASLFSDVVSHLSDNSVLLELQDGKMKISAGRSTFQILTQPAEDYPPVEGPAGDAVEITLPQAALRRKLRETTFSAAKEDTRNVLMGIYFEARGNNLTLVSTDTHRLSWSRLELLQPASQPVTAVIPARPLSELEKVLQSGGDENLTLRFSASQVSFITPEVELVARLLDGQFPNYEKVIPKTHDRVLSIDREDLQGALRRVYIVVRRSDERVVLSAEGNALQVEAQSPEVGTAFESVPLQLEGDAVKVAYNARYLLDALNILDSERIVLELTTAHNPGLLRPVDRDDFVYIVMPMQL